MGENDAYVAGYAQRVKDARHDRRLRAAELAVAYTSADSVAHNTAEAVLLEYMAPVSDV
jgi:hypothetical protein